MNNTSSPVKAFKRSASLTSNWYMGINWYIGILTSNFAENKDTGGSFCLVEATSVPGTEPPPHVHSREDELFYVLEGQFEVFVGADVFTVEAGECVFLPRLMPHVWVIQSPRLRFLTLFTPAGLEEVFRSMTSPTQNLESSPSALTYSTADPDRTARRFGEYGVRFLTPEEIANQLPLYPRSLLSKLAR